MARKIHAHDLITIEEAVKGHTGGASLSDIVNACPSIPKRTLQARIKKLVDRGRLVRRGDRRGALYFTLQEKVGFLNNSVSENTTELNNPGDDLIPVSKEGEKIRDYVTRPMIQRQPVGYDGHFFNDYLPNHSFYLSKTERRHLNERGRCELPDAPAGTYARDILNRLLIDLAWNSSRLEGNTYSLLDTERLIHFNRAADGKSVRDATMILNHKAAIEFIVENAGEIDIEPVTVLNLHALLSSDLLSDPDAPGRLRRVPVRIGNSVFHPLEVPQVIEENFHTLLLKAKAIEDPFEKAFFLMVQLPYLQPFDDVNKRVSRLAANIPLIKHNLAPVSFIDVPNDIYVQGILGVYELKQIELMRDVFIWAYERSAAKYAIQRQSIGEPDPFRIKWRNDLRALIADIISKCLTASGSETHIRAWAERNVDARERDRFIRMAESELLGVRESNFARYRVRPSEYYTWRQAWK